MSEIERLQREGIPPMPGLRDEEVDLLAEEDWGPEDQDPVDSGPSIETNTRVAESADEITIERNHFEKRKIEFQRLELERRFQEHDKQAADQSAARVLSARQQRDQELEAARQRGWRDDWLDYALRSLPEDAPPEVRANLPDLVDEALSRTDSREAQHVPQSLIDATLAQVLKPHRHRQAANEMIQQAVDRLPPEVKGSSRSTDWRLRARVAAHQEVRKLPADASTEEIELCVHQAVDPIIREFEHKRLCEQVVSQLTIPGATLDELKEIKVTLKHALDSLSVGSSPEQIKTVVVAVVSPLFQRFLLREDRALREEVLRYPSFPAGFPGPEKEQALRAAGAAISQLAQCTPRQELEAARDRALQPFLAAHQLRQNKAQRVESGVNEVSFYLMLLSMEGKFRDNDLSVRAKLKDRIRKQLEMQLKGSESMVEVQKLVRRLIHQELGLQPKTP